MVVLVQTANMAERTVAAHAHGLDGIKAAVRAGVTSIEHGSMLDDETVRLMAEHGTYLVPTMMAFEDVRQRALAGTLGGLPGLKAIEIYPYFRESIQLAMRAGVKIGFGTDAGVFPHGENAGEFRLLVDVGHVADGRDSGRHPRSSEGVASNGGTGQRGGGQGRGSGGRARRSAGGHRSAAEHRLRHEGRRGLQTGRTRRPRRPATDGGGCQGGALSSSPTQSQSDGER